MKMQKLIVVVAVLLFVGIGSSWAGGRFYGGVGVYVGPGPYWGGPYYGRPFFPGPYWYPGPYYPPTQVIVVPPPEPMVYIEKDYAPAEPAKDTKNYWYFCRESNGYYPYVSECPRGWQRVDPLPAR